MADRWLYIHAGAAHGPVDQDKLTQLATQGKLLPADLVWRVGEDRGRAVEAHTLVTLESFPAGSLPPPRPVATEIAVAAPPSPGAAPDWLADVEAEQPPPLPTDVVVAEAGDVEVVTTGADVETVHVEGIGDVELVEQPLVAEPIAPPPAPAKPPKLPSSSRKGSAPRKKRATSRDADADLEEEDDDDDQEESGGLSFRRRDLLMLGLGMAGVGLAVAAGLFFARRSQRKSKENPPPPPQPAPPEPPKTPPEEQPPPTPPDENPQPPPPNPPPDENPQQPPP